MRPRPSPLWLPVAAVLALAVAGPLAATGDTQPAWRPLSLPAVADRPVVTVRAVTHCPGRWYAAGGTATRSGATSPALWQSPDGTGWRPVALHPVTLYGQHATFSGVACRGGTIVLFGAANGGAHGNPRPNTWTGDVSGVTEVPAPFDLYAGDRAVGTGRLVAGPPGFLITGARVAAGTGLAGGALWHSPDGHTFTLVDDDPVLRSTPAGQTAVSDAAPVADGWLAVGSVLPAGTVNRTPAAWWSADGTGWRREPLTGEAGTDRALERVVAWRGGALAVGTRGTRFGAWLHSGASWRAGGDFGAFRGTAVPAVTGLATGPPGVTVAGCDGTACRLWTSSDGRRWREVALPAPVPATAGHRLLLAADGRQLLVVADDGRRPRLWLAPAG